MPKNSYVTSLFNEGLDRMAQKVGEEAVETVIAAKNEAPEAFLNESADLLFHLMVLWEERAVGLAEVVEVLRGRA